MTGLPTSLKEAGCRKPHCRTGTDTLHRHHKRHQAMWLGIWASVRRDEVEFQEFVERYNQFVPEDVVYICEHHHAEIHLIYDEIIREHKAKLDKPLYKYTWNEANELMTELEAACIVWLSKETEGFSSDVLRKKRKMVRASQKRKRRRRR